MKPLALLAILITPIVSLHVDRLAHGSVSVLTDIGPTHSLVSMVMEGVAEPDVLMDKAASPHDYSLRPSDAEKISQAQIIFYISADLTPWLDRVRTSLAKDTRALELLSSADTHTLPFRTGHHFEDDDHAHGSSHDDDSHSSTDPHAWLDPENAKVWLRHIQSELSIMDPDNAGTYKKNTDLALSELDELILHVDAQLASIRETPFFVLHDSYHYFESRFQLNASGTIKLGDNSRPSISQISSIRKTLRSVDGACVFKEPQFNDRLVKTVTQRTNTHLGELDPLGANIQSGKHLYQTLIRQLASNLVDCLNLVK